MADWHIPKGSVRTCALKQYNICLPYIHQNDAATVYTYLSYMLALSHSRVHLYLQYISECWQTIEMTLF